MGAQAAYANSIPGKDFSRAIPRLAGAACAAFWLAGCALWGGAGGADSRSLRGAGPVSPTTATLTGEPVSRAVSSLPEEEQAGRAGENPVVLEVNHQRVRLDEYQARLREFAAAQGLPPGQAETRAAFERALVNELLLLDYARRRGVDRSPAYREALRQAQRRLLLDFVRREYILADVTVTEEEIEAWYQERLEEFTSPRQAQVRVIQTISLSAAETALSRARSGQTPFADLARAYSIHPSRSRGGELDPFPRGFYANDPVFEEVAFKLRIGEISDVVATGQGYFIIQKVGEVAEHREPLESARERIRERLLQEKRDEAERRFLESLRQMATIEPPTAAAP